jgi:hypothetical protein
MAYWLVGRNHGGLGEFAAGLDALARGLAIAEAIGDRRIQSHFTSRMPWAI